MWASYKGLGGEDEGVEAWFVDEGCFWLVLQTRYLNQVCGFVLIIYMYLQSIGRIAVSQRHCHVLAYEESQIPWPFTREHPLHSNSVVDFFWTRMTRMGRIIWVFRTRIKRIKKIKEKILKILSIRVRKKHQILKIMKNKDFWRTIIQVVVSILTARWLPWESRVAWDYCKEKGLGSRNATPALLSWCSLLLWHSYWIFITGFRFETIHLFHCYGFFL